MSSGDQEWRVPTDAETYFLHEQKRLRLADRRPVIRSAADLVGPGIAALATQVDNLNDALATINGYFSADSSADNKPSVTGPHADDRFIGVVVTDAEYGGFQQFMNLRTGYTYTRRFYRNPFDHDLVTFDLWVSDEPVAPTPPDPEPYWIGSATEPARTTNGWATHTVTPTLTNTNDPSGDVFTAIGGGLRIDQEGVYRVEATVAFSVGVDGVRFGAALTTANNTGSIQPLVAPGGTALGGLIVPLGSTQAPHFSAGATVRVLAAGATVRVQNFVNTTTSRVATVSLLSAFRVAD